MTLSAHTLTLVALIAIGLSLLAIGFVVFAGGSAAREPASVLTGDDIKTQLLLRRHSNYIFVFLADRRQSPADRNRRIWQLL